MFENRIHKGTVLDVSEDSFDAGGATFGSVFCDEEDPDTLYLFYTGAMDVQWSGASIGLAISNDGLKFRKLTELNPVLRSDEIGYREAVTPAVFKARGHFYMVFAGSPLGKRRRLCMACSSDPKGPWRFVGDLVRPEDSWEGDSIDVGPSVVNLEEDQVLVYYSNVSTKSFLSRLLGSKCVLRRIGILRLRVKSPSKMEACRFEGNPLKHLNGHKGSWNESLFCPGYAKFANGHYLFPAASTYSVGFPYRQYVGLVTDSSPYFQRPQSMRILMNGPKEKEKMMTGVTGEIALDSPCPLVRRDGIHLFYAVMDRDYGVWRTGLTIFPFSPES